MDTFIRSIAVEQHPVVRKTYIIPTPSIDAFYERVTKAITYGLGGTMVYGQSRFGKTWAIRYVTQMLSIEYPGIAVFTFLQQQWRRHTEDGFFTHLLEAAGHAHPHAGKNPQKRSRLMQLLRHRAEQATGRTLVIFVDEAQRADLIEYEWLRDIYDGLERYSIRVLVFLVGQPQLLYQKNSFRQAQENQIVGRFMTHEMAFRGLTSVDDVATCLAGYDENCFPERSDWTYTRFFFPQAYGDGFRLLSQATSLWEAFLEAHERARFSFAVELPMKYFTQAVEIVFLKHRHADSPELRLSPAIWQQAVIESGYVSAQRAVHAELPDIEDEAQTLP